MRILMIEDDEALCEVLSYALVKEGYDVDVCHEGDDGLRWMRERAHDLVLLDRMLPRLDGATLLKRAREDSIATPVLMITALGSVEDRVEGLDVGADDYIVKPFATSELLARIRAIGRRPREWSGAAEIVYGPLTLDASGKTLCCGGDTISLSKREADLLEYLMKSAGRTVPRSTLLAHVWGPDAAIEDGNLDSYIYFLRQRLKSLNNPLAIVTVRNVGYSLQLPEEGGGT